VVKGLSPPPLPSPPLLFIRVLAHPPPVQTTVPDSGPQWLRYSRTFVCHSPTPPCQTYRSLMDQPFFQRVPQLAQRNPSAHPPALPVLPQALSGACDVTTQVQTNQERPSSNHPCELHQRALRQTVQEGRTQRVAYEARLLKMPVHTRYGEQQAQNVTGQLGN
jgi:hypothetical protein